MQKEAKARIKINNLLQETGWRFFDDEKKGARNIEVEGNVNLENLGDDFEHSIGFIDYLLLDVKGSPLAVLEAKSSSKDPVAGKKQAEDYAKAKRCRFIILSNGDTHYFWDLNQNAEKIILKFPTQKDLTKLLSATTAMPLSGIDVKNDWIVLSQGAVAEEEKKYLRDYQLEALKTIAAKFDSNTNNRRFLLEMATGTGKTLLAAALIKLFLNTGNASRIIFLVDRIELAQQALQNISSYLKEYNLCIFKENKDQALQNQVVIATIQSLSYNQNYLKYFSQFDFDLLISDEAHRSIYGNNRAIFEYFQAIKIGLTATPKDYLKNIDEKDLADTDPRKLEKRILFDTYKTFGCEKGEPSFRFDLKAAVNHQPPYLVNPIIYDKRSDKTNQMLSDQGWTDAFIDEVTGERVEETFKIRQLERKVFSDSLSRLIVDEFLKTSQKDPITRETGKSIIYCISQNHASKIARLLNQAADKNWPGKYSGHSGVFARQITSNVVGSQDLAKKFRNNQLGATRVVVTVNMMTTGYDCTDLLNVVLMRPIFSITDFIQIKGRGTRLHTFKNELTKTEIKKDNFHLIDFFGVCEYFEEKYDFTVPIKLLSVLRDKPIRHYGQIKTEDKTVLEKEEAPIAVLHGHYIYIGTDFLVRDNQLVVGPECMRVDREAYRGYFEESVKDLIKIDPFFESAITKDDIEATEEIAQEKILEKPIYYFTLDSLRKAYQTGNALIDFLKKAAGLIPKLPNKYDRLNQGFEEFKLIYSDTPFEKLNYFQNIYECYLTSPDYRLALEKGNLAALDDQAFGGIVPVGRVNREEVEKVVNYIKESKIAYVN
ncbi:MAG: DEAD/DEAH box helicase family protein [bacterium]